MNWQLCEKTFAIVGSGDIGKATAQALEQEGAKAILLSRKANITWMLLTKNLLSSMDRGPRYWMDWYILQA